ATHGESSTGFPMLIEKPKEGDICMKETNVKRDYVYTVHDIVCFFDIKIEKLGRKCILTKEHK
ncbi:hypothetical protein CLU79DRAFT_675747, partial [Phycomyces nitens]